MKSLKWMLAAGMSLGAAGLFAEVPELTALLPEQKGYELVAKCNPLTYSSAGMSVDNSSKWEGKLTKVGFLLKLTDKNDKTEFVFAAMDPFCGIEDLTVPVDGMKPVQTFVNNLEVFSNSGKVKTGKFEKGNVEIWAYNYGGQNSLNIPGAKGNYDFGDGPAKDGGYGSFQIHNYLQQETVLAFNNFNQGSRVDLGIGNNPDKKGNPDWTFAATGKNYKSAELLIVARIEGKKEVANAVIDPQTTFLPVFLKENKVSFAPGETMTFELNWKIAGPAPKKPYYIKWTRTGDDGKKLTGKHNLLEGPLVIKTSLDKPGFVRIYATLHDYRGKLMKKTVKDWRGQPRSEMIFFDGGAGVEIDKLQGIPEPADFDAFWEKQRARLAAVPMTGYEMKKVNELHNGKFFVYAVKVPCPGPRPATGYLVMPKDAKPKSCKIVMHYQGYGFSKQGRPGWAGNNEIHFHVNAHGMNLEADNAYYTKLGESIKSGKYGYAFDPAENADAEKCYFNGMALRLLRAQEFAKSLPAWDGRNLKVEGGSQGGLQSVWAAGLDKDVTESYPGIPWCCDMGGTELKRLRGGWYIHYTPALGYYDPINVAKRIKCKTFITRAGLGDYTCPPSGVAILYNNIKGPKRINWVQGSQHGYVPPKELKMQSWNIQSDDWK